MPSLSVHKVRAREVGLRWDVQMEGRRKNILFLPNPEGILFLSNPEGIILITLVQEQVLLEKSSSRCRCGGSRDGVAWPATLVMFVR